MKFTGETEFTDGLTLEQKLGFADSIHREILNSKNSYVVGIDISEIACLYRNLTGEERLVVIMVERSVGELLNPDKVRWNSESTRIYTLIDGDRDCVFQKLKKINEVITKNFGYGTTIVGIPPSEDDKELIMLPSADPKKELKEGDKIFYTQVFDKLNRQLDTAIMNRRNIEIYTLEGIPCDGAYRNV